MLYENVIFFRKHPLENECVDIAAVIVKRQILLPGFMEVKLVINITVLE